MWSAYIDESGDNGAWSRDGGGGSRTYTLGCVMVRQRCWLDVFDRLIEFRRAMRRRYGLLVRAEVKANYLVRGRGSLVRLNLNDHERRDIYTQHLRMLHRLAEDERGRPQVRAFAVVVRKDRPNPVGDPRAVAWETMLQRLERFTTKGGTYVSINHDEGADPEIRGWARKARRAGTAGSAFGAGQLRVPFTGLVDDPVPRDSSDSYLIQVADLLAYAAFRRVVPAPPRGVPVVTDKTWDAVGDALLTPVNRLSGGPPAIVVRR